MFGWLHRKAIEKTAVPECSDKAVDAWMRWQNGAEKLRKDEFREIGKHCYRDPGQAKDDEERNRWLLDREVALEWYCRWKRTLIQLNDERFQADLRRRRELLELECACLRAVCDYSGAGAQPPVLRNMPVSTKHGFSGGMTVKGQ